MGQKINPISNRIGIIRGWDSNWYGIREYLYARISKVNLSKIVIERTLKLITVTIHTSRPGAIIGKGGQEVDKLKEELRKITNKEVQINIFEVKRPELDANIVANNIARQVEGRVSAPCVWAPRVSRCSSAAVSAALKWPVRNSTRKAVRLCTPSVPISTTLLPKLIPRSAFWVSRYGSALVRSTESEIFLPMQV